MIDGLTLLTICLMALTTYLSRIIGFLALHKRQLSPRMQSVMQNVPGCVLISVIAPAFVSDQPANLIALAITVLAATRLSLLPTVLVGICSAAVLRYLLGS